MTVSRLQFWTLLGIFLYSAGQMLWYWQTPLGASPVLDGRENIEIARQISEGSLAREIFYRAMLYPGALSLFFFAGVPTDLIPMASSSLGLLLHLISTFFAMRLSWRLWGNELGVLITGLLVGANPVLLHFALDPLDNALAICLFLGGLVCVFHDRNDEISQNAKWRIAAGFALIGLSALARPHFLAGICGLALLYLWQAWRGNRLASIGAPSLIGLAIPLIAYGGIQLLWSGTFGILPAQGPYNLYISNNREANGLYFRQSIEIVEANTHENPTRIEARTRYLEAAGKVGTVAERNTHWRRETIESISDEPIRWIRLMLFKAYAMGNDFEQYNNKTFSFHKSLSPFLRYNPIGWTLLFATAACSIFATARDPRVRNILVGSAIAYASGVIIYMASSRFRAPLYPVMAIFAGGLPVLIASFRQFPIRKMATIASTAVFIIAIGYSKFGDIASKKTFIQDRSLLASAAGQLGRDLEAIDWATQVYEENPNRIDALRLRLISYYNIVASGKSDLSSLSWRDFENEIDAIPNTDSTVCFVKGVARWNLGQRAEAISQWKSGVEEFEWNASNCLGAILLIDSSASTPDISTADIRIEDHPILAVALARRSALNSSMDGARLNAIATQIERAIPESMRPITRAQ